jgi:hypothetical protein
VERCSLGCKCESLVDVKQGRGKGSIVDGMECLVQ